MSTHLIVLQTSPHQPARLVRLTNDLDTMRAAVGGGYLEAIVGDGWSAYLDEEGRLKGLQGNRDATRLAASLGFKESPPWDAIGLVGPVVFMGPPHDGGETSITDEVITLAVQLNLLTNRHVADFLRSVIQ